MTVVRELADSGLTQSEIARKAGINVKRARQALTVLRDAPDLAAAVSNGHMKLIRAYQHAMTRRCAGMDLSALAYLTVDEMAAMLRVHPLTVNRLIHGGDLVAVRVGHSFRIPVQAARMYLTGQSATATTRRGNATQANEAPVGTGSSGGNSDLLAPGEASAMFGVTRTTLTSWARRGLLPCTRTPGGHRRYRLGDLRAVLTMHTDAPEPTGEAPAPPLRPSNSAEGMPGATRHGTGRLPAQLGPASVSSAPDMMALPGLGPLEAAIMSVLWDSAEPLTVRTVLHRLDYRARGGGRPAYTTVMTVATILWRKGLLSRTRLSRGSDQRAWWYQARATRDDYLAAIIRRALDCTSDPAALASRELPALSGSLRQGTAATTLAGSSPATMPLKPSTGHPAQRWITTVDGHRLRQLRRERGLSQATLAAQAGISQRTIARLELGAAQSCRGRTLARLAAALDERPATLTPQYP